MKTTNFIVYTLTAGLVLTASTQSGAQVLSPASNRIAAAEKQIDTRVAGYEVYNDLALALARRARETANPEYYTQAEAAIRRSLELSPENFGALKMRAWVLLGKHEFAAALELARALNKRMPDDLLVYGFLTDANAELGNYADAENACQWMLDLRPGNVSAFTRAAFLRELFGDIEGSIELMSASLQRTPPVEIEDRAWLLTQLGHLELTAGRTENAERILQEALVVFPDYHYALATLAKVRSAQQRYGDAVTLLEKRYKAAAHAENLYDLAVALKQAGRPSEAEAAFQDFERLALRESERWDNANRELVFYYADHAGKPAEALRIAELEAARRTDVYTLDVMAWALYVNDRHREATETMARALAIGIKDPAVLSRAHAINADQRH